MSEPAMRESERRLLNIGEILLITVLVATSGLVFKTREAVVALTSKVENQTDELTRLRNQLADVPALSSRVSRLEVQMDAQAEAIKELRATRGLK